MLSKNQVRFIQSLQQKKNREKTGLFIAEGEKTVKELLKDKSWKIQTVIGESDFFTSNPEIDFKEFELVETTREELQRISGLQTVNKAIAVVHQQNHEQKDLTKGLVLILDDIRDPGNLGTIIRIADWFGISTIVCSATTVELYNPKVIQATMGSFLRVNVYYRDLEVLMKENTQIPVYCTVLEGENIYKADLPEHAWIVIGNEGNGVSEKIINLSSNRITIPSFSNGDGAESLNAAIATSLVCAEFRSRKFRN